MPKHCCAVGCSNHNMMNRKVSFHKFPHNNPIRFQKWLSAVRRINPDGSKWMPSANTALCGSHFISGKPNPDPDHPDYAPSLFRRTGVLVSQQKRRGKILDPNPPEDIQAEKVYHHYQIRNGHLKQKVKVTKATVGVEEADCFGGHNVLTNDRDTGICDDTHVTAGVEKSDYVSGHVNLTNTRDTCSDHGLKNKAKMFREKGIKRVKSIENKLTMVLPETEVNTEAMDGEESDSVVDVVQGKEWITIDKETDIYTTIFTQPVVSTEENNLISDSCNCNFTHTCALVASVGSEVKTENQAMKAKADGIESAEGRNTELYTEMDSSLRVQKHKSASLEKANTSIPVDTNEYARNAKKNDNISTVLNHVKEKIDSETENNENIDAYGVQKNEGEQTQDKENMFLKEREMNVKNKDPKSSNLGLKMEAGRSEVFKNYAGISWGVALTVFEFLIVSLNIPKFDRGNIPKFDKGFTMKEQFFVTLLKLRHDMSFEHLASRTCISSQKLRAAFWRWVEALNEGLNFVMRWPAYGSASVPEPFRRDFPKLTLLVDCFSVSIEIPSSPSRAFKERIHKKVFIATTPQGGVSFLSRACHNSVQDADLIKNSGFLEPNLHSPGDQILSLKDIPLQDDFKARCGVELFVYSEPEKQRPVHERLKALLNYMKKVTSLIKNRFKILSGTLPVGMINSLTDDAEIQELEKVDKILGACAILINLGEGVRYTPKKS